VKFTDIKPGDRVILPSGNGSPGFVATVERVTKTQFSAGNARWLRDRGAQVGSSRDPWRSNYAQPATPERIAACDAYLQLHRVSMRCSRYLNQLSTATREQEREAYSSDDRLHLAAKLERVALHLEQSIQALGAANAEVEG
jgi:hypothetical protein